MPTTLRQELISLPVRVVDPEGQPVVGAVVIPWALRSALGHGHWQADRVGGAEPPTLVTDQDGKADFVYPRYAALNEQVATTQVTLSIDHPEFAYVGYQYINVPALDMGPHAITLQRGVVIDLAPVENGEPAPLRDLYAMWNDGRSWKAGVAPAVVDGALRLPPIRPGNVQALLVRLEGGLATHFSPIFDLDLEDGAKLRQSAELRPAVRIEGSLSENVPRPVKNGRIQAETLPKQCCRQNVEWRTWARIAEDGTFVIESWPPDEAIQMIALCDGHIAESGKPPAGIEGRESDRCRRPQVFSPQAARGPIVLRMQPIGRCMIETVDEQGLPLAGVKVGSYPNVGWWNGGSQIYCESLMRGEKLLVERDYRGCIEDVFPDPFERVTDSQGRAGLHLPAGRQPLYAGNDDYELPVVQGRRRQSATLVAGQVTTTRLVLQPKGTDPLGDWDKAAGVLFGCGNKQGRALLENPGFREKIERVRAMLAPAGNPTDPSLLRAAYEQLADAFDKLGDKEEASKWRIKAAQQAAKLLPTGKQGASETKP
jgi:hypothetical protein